MTKKEVVDRAFALLVARRPSKRELTELLRDLDGLGEKPMTPGELAETWLAIRADELHSDEVGSLGR